MRACTAARRRRYDVLVVGAGPSGAAAGYWLAAAGHRVLVVEKKRFPREKTCGDGLTPRAVRQLHDMGLAEPARRTSSASTACGRSATASRSSCAWPEHPDFPRYGYVVRRRDLDEMVADRAVKAGADAVAGDRGGRAARRRTAVARRDRASGTTPGDRDVRARYVVVADGANSRFGRALGTARDRTLPAGHGDSRLLHEPVPRRALDREPPRPPRPRRQPPARATAGSSRSATAR